MGRRSGAAAQPIHAHPMSSSEDRIICTRCGCKGGEHKANDGRCPPTSSWGAAKPFPSFKHAGESPAADAKLDRALAKYWGGRQTFSLMR